MAAANLAASKPSKRGKGPALTGSDRFWRGVLKALSWVLLIVGVATLALALVAYVAGIFISNPLKAATLAVEQIWFLVHSFSLDLFQVFIERKIFFWLPNPTDPWFNVVRPILFQTPLTLGAIGAVFTGFGWGIGRVLK